MSGRARVALAVAGIAVAAAVGVVAIAAVSTDHPPAARTVAEPAPRAGAPPLTLDLGFRSDVEARDLRRAEKLYNGGDRHRAGAIFARHDSLEAKVGAAMSRWPGDAVDRLLQLAGLHEGKALVQLHLGLSMYWARRSGAEDAWEAAISSEPDTPYAITAGDLLHPGFVPGLPPFTPGFDAPASIVALPAAKQLPALAALARTGGVRGKLLYGVGLQRVGRPVSAERAFGAAARAAPGNAEAQVAAAVGLFDKADPARAFSRLGPLARRFPGKATVRFHLGLLLLWSGDVATARRQLQLATRAEPGSPLAAAAKAYLERLDG